MPPISSRLLYALIGLIALSGLSALAASGVVPVNPAIVAGAILMLALIKVRVILADYLELAQGPSWLKGFLWVIGLWAVLVMGLYLGPLLI